MNEAIDSDGEMSFKVVGSYDEEDNQKEDNKHYYLQSAIFMFC